MIKLKVLMTIFIVATVLLLGQPAVRSAEFEIPPAVVFVQDKDNKMMVNHNFEADNRINIPWGSIDDPGFFVDISK